MSHLQTLTVGPMTWVICKVQLLTSLGYQEVNRGVIIYQSLVLLIAWTCYNLFPDRSNRVLDIYIVCLAEKRILQEWELEAYSDEVDHLLYIGYVIDDLEYEP